MKKISHKRRCFVLKLGQVLGAASVSGLSSPVFAESKDQRANIKSVASKKSANGGQRLIFKLDKSIEHKTFTLFDPKKSNRVIIDFLNTHVQSRKALTLGRDMHLVKNLRHAFRGQKNYRVVLDLTTEAVVSSQVKSNRSGYFLEVVLTPKKQSIATQHKAKKAISAVGRKNRRKKIIVAIDAGHGGRYPGAVGKRQGTLEKDVVLKIAKRLEKHVNKQSGMKAVLTRDGDYALSLRKRIKLAHANKADLFISIHADANLSKNVTGSSVYILNEKGASSEAVRWIANKENSYERTLAGANMSGKNKTISELIFGLSQEKTKERSLALATDVLKELGSFNRLLRRKVESANFLVLKSPDIPSILVETAFLSNPEEERRLRTNKYQEKLAKAIFKGVRHYQKTA